MSLHPYNQDLLIYQARKLRNQALKMRKQGERREARYRCIELFKKAMYYDPMDGRSYVGIGTVQLQLNDIKGKASRRLI